MSTRELPPGLARVVTLPDGEEAPPISAVALADAPEPGAAEPTPVLRGPAVTGMLPADVCTLFGVLPLSREGRTASVGITDPSDHVARRVVELRLREQGVEEVEFLPMGGPALGRTPTRTRSPIRRRITRPGAPRRGAAHPVLPTRPPAGGVGPAVPEAPTAPATPVTPAEVTRDALLGDRLVAAGLITELQLNIELERQRREGGRIGEVLCHSGLVRETDMAQVLAVQADRPYVDLGHETIDPDVARRLPARMAQRRRVLPWREEDGVVDVAVADPFDRDLVAQLQEQFSQLRVFVAADGELDVALQSVYGADHVDAAIGHLASERAEDSAATTFTKGQKRLGLAIALVGLIGLVINPITTIVVFNIFASLFYISSSIYKLILARDSFHVDVATHVTPEQIAELDERELPTFTILMPMYREAEVVQKLVGSIAALDYPRHKLDVKLLLEEDDEETLAAIRQLDLRPHFRVVIVPDALPKTKPKACNYGLLLARGDITVIYDAEDEPDPDQLKKVVVAFRDSDPSMVCVQCKLNYYNRTQNLLTRWFTTEYSQWFDIFLPGLDSHDVPIPLGGTSNHFVTSQLVDLGAWDPYNVAEDADLGIRLSKNRWRTGVVDSTTYEEANPELGNWIRQRSRWVKGYMQTWLVHMRRPWQLLRTLGFRSFMSFNFSVGGTFFGFLLNPIYWALTTMWIFTEAGLIRSFFPSLVYYAAALGLFVGNFTFTYLNAVASMRRGYFGLVKWALVSPLYWALMSIAAWKGAIQLITKPHYWEKTDHGLATERIE